MAETTKILHPYPDEFEREWYSRFQSFAASVDESDFAGRDDRNIAAVGGGTISTSVVGTIVEVAWSEAIELYHGSTGFIGVMGASDANLELEDGDAVYVQVVRGPSQGYTLQYTQTAGPLPNNDQAWLMFYRRGDLIWTRFGVINAGGAISSDPFVVAVVPLVTREVQGDGILTMGRCRLNVSDYGPPGDISLNLRVEAQNTVLVVQSDIEFYDATAGDVLKASFDLDNDDQPQQFEATFTPEDDSTDRVYELRAGLDGGPGAPYDPTDEVIVWNAVIEVIRS